MDERGKIADQIRKKEREIESLEERLKTARVYLHAFRDVLKMLDTAPASGSGAAALKPGSAVAQARDAILRARKPLHITALLGALSKEDNRESRASLASSLAAYARRGEIFIRSAPNTFGLSELGHEAIKVPDEVVPPAGFGRVSIAERAPQVSGPSRPTPPISQASPSPRAPKPPDDDDIPF